MVVSEISSAVCTDVDIENVQTLQKRVGASVIIGAGSGAAMDVAKALSAASTWKLTSPPPEPEETFAAAPAPVPAALSWKIQQAPNDDALYAFEQTEALYLIPCTSAAALASLTPYSLVFDTKEETIVSRYVKPHHHGGGVNNNNSNASQTLVTKVLWDEAELLIHPETHAACQAILLDAIMFRKSNWNATPNTFATTSSFIPTNLTTLPLLELLQLTAQHLSCGLGEEHRSIPLCLALSLIPPLFASTHMFTFWASLVPALKELTATVPDGRIILSSSINTSTRISTSPLQPNQEQHQQQLQHQPLHLLEDLDYPALASLALEAQSVERMMEHIRHNQWVTHAMDWNDSLLTRILNRSLDR